LETWSSVLEVATSVAWGWGSLSVARAAVLETGTAVLEVSAHSHGGWSDGGNVRGCDDLVQDQFCLKSELSHIYTPVYLRLDGLLKSQNQSAHGSIFI
jgi:hypothetical protein